MATRFRFVEEDLTTVVLDLLALSGGASTGFDLVGDPNLGITDRDDPPPEGSGELKTLTQMDFRLRAKHISADGYKALLRSLAAVISDDAILEYRADGATVSDFMRTKPSSIAATLRGQERALFHVVKLLSDFSYPVQLWREGLLEQTEETLVSASARTNEAGNQSLKLTSAASVDTPARIEFEIPEAGADVVEIRFSIAPTTEALIAALEDLRAFELDTAGGGLSFGTNTTSQTDTGNVSGDKFARTAYTDEGYFRMRWRLEITPTDTADLEGEYLVVPIVRGNAGTLQTLQLRWGLRDVEALDRVNDSRELDLQEAAEGIWVPFDLGKVKFPANAQKLILEGWSRLDSTFVSGDRLDWDYVLLLGANGKLTVLSVQGFLGEAESSREKWRGSDLVTPGQPAGFNDGVIEEGAVLLGEDAAVGPLPNAGTIYPAGKLIVRAIGVLTQQAGSPRQKLGELRVRDITANADETVRDLNTRKNRVYTHFDKKVVVDTDGSSAYQPQVVGTDSDAYNFVTVEELRTKFIRTLQNGDKFVIDPDDPDETGIWSGGVKIADLYLQGGLPELTRGENLMTVQALDWSGKAYMDDVTDEPLGKVVHDRQVEVTVKYKARNPL